MCTALVVTAAACAAAPARSSSTLRPPPPRSSTTTARPVAKPGASVGAVRPAPGYTDTTPPPAIRATGSDYPAIARSLLSYKDWLFAHHPDPALAGQVFQQGTAIYGSRVADITTVRNLRRRIDSVDLRLRFTVVTVRPDLVTMRMLETLVADEWFDQHHRVVRTDPYPVPNHYIVILTHDGGGRWRIADVTQVAIDPSIVITR